MTEKIQAPQPAPGSREAFEDALKTKPEARFWNATDAMLWAFQAGAAGARVPSTEGGDVTDDQAIELASALELQRAVRIVDDVAALPLGGKDADQPTQFQAGYQLACEEIAERLRTEVHVLPGGLTLPACGPLPSIRQFVSKATAATPTSDLQRWVQAEALVEALGWRWNADRDLWEPVQSPAEGDGSRPQAESSRPECILSAMGDRVFDGDDGYEELLECLRSAPAKKEFDLDSFVATFFRAVDTRGWSAKQVAEATGVSETTISRMRNHRRAPDAASLAVLADWAGINPAKHMKASESNVQPKGPVLSAKEWTARQGVVWSDERMAGWDACVAQSTTQAPAPAQSVTWTGYTSEQIADACVAAEIPDSKYEALVLALADAEPPDSPPPVIEAPAVGAQQYIKSWSPFDRGELAGDGKPCPNSHDPDCRWPNCGCRAREAFDVPVQKTGDANG